MRNSNSLRHGIMLLLMAGWLPVLMAQQQVEPYWTNADKQFLLERLSASHSGLIKQIEHLKQEQFAFTPDSSKWTIAEVVEHLGLYEELLYWDILNNQYTEERPDLVNAVMGKDSIMLAYATDPAKGIAPFAAQPMGRFTSKSELVHFVDHFRKAVINLITESNADFRLHFIFRPPDWGVWHIRDLHQYILQWMAHTERHTNQIKMIQANPMFPHP